jgi:hypothetical protein
MSVYNLTALEEKDCRDASDAVIHWNVIALVDVALANEHLALELCCELVDDRSDSLAWTAPCCPEIHYYRDLAIDCFCEIRIV